MYIQMQILNKKLYPLSKLRTKFNNFLNKKIAKIAKFFRYGYSYGRQTPDIFQNLKFFEIKIFKNFTRTTDVIFIERREKFNLKSKKRKFIYLNACSHRRAQNSPFGAPNFTELSRKNLKILGAKIASQCISPFSWYY